MSKNETRQNIDFKVGDVVVCIKEISSNWGGPKEGEIYTVLIVSDELTWIGFKLQGRVYGVHGNIPPHSISEKDLSISNGEVTNWASHCFRHATPYEIAYHQFPDRLEKIINE